ncbi:serine/threonine-protein kinase [Nannocystis pusilla]|uniref:mitogen-activated protein kinase kinase n=1 Tax=Nannocystis pusilla TaxID=889268 RepID=A0ABS7TRY3_9BACT|nr:serine/threonine-protein kinase [Nannocystis pusilla]MBZ5710997.1 protein kinase [Nannocystis pusilla]
MFTSRTSGPRRRGTRSGGRPPAAGRLLRPSSSEAPHTTGDRVCRDIVAESAPGPFRHPRYELRGELGSGSFGVVYRAYDRERACDIAVKVLNQVHPRSLLELRSELRARADVHHPNLLQIYGLEVGPRHAFLTMELVEDAVSFVEHVRGGPDPPVERLTSASIERLVRATHGLLAALHRLHGAGFVHRDVKPQNVLVNARTGELRLADFGLAIPWAGLAATTRGGYLYGTPAYVAPELWWGAPATPAADLYSTGVMLLEALTGRRPEAAATGPMPIPERLRETLGELIPGLLVREPHRRLDASAACSQLRTLAPQLRLPQFVKIVSPVYVGRVGERAQVTALLDSSASARVWICGPSGIGKTSFVEHILSSWTGAGDGVVLRGRCHPQEHVSFRAWDEIAGQLAHHLGRERVDRELTPGEAAALRSLFPVFFQEPATEPQEAVAAPRDADLRRLAVRAFRGLLAVVSRARRLVIWVDDLQWADPDSLALLSDLLERGVGDTAWLLTYRQDDDEPAFRAGLCAAPLAPAQELELRLGPLDHGDVDRLLHDLGLPQGTADAETRELLAVLPMFAPELAATAAEGESATRPSLTSLVARRIADLDERRIRVLDTVAASPRPIPWTLLAEAVERPSELFDDFLALRQAGLLRRSQDGAGAPVWTYHDLIREARLGGLTPSAARDIHNRLIHAYDRLAPDEHEALAHHLEHAGDAPRAAQSLVLAGTRAIGQLAFASAASHLDRAFALDAVHATSWQLQTRRAECDANRGLARAAGARYEQAARLREASEGPSTTVELRSRAARELICCGQIDSGYEILRQVMHGLGTRLPRNHLGTLAWSATLRGRLLLREPKRRQGPPPPGASAHLDALWTGCTALSHINHALADVFLLRHLMLALQVGDDSHLMKSLTFEAVAEATIGGALLLRRSDRLMARARELCERRDDDYDWAWYWTSRMSRAAFDCDWPATVEHSLRAETYYDRRRYGIAWERSIARIYRAIALSMMGDMTALREVVRTTAEDARERDDPVAINGVRSGHPAILQLYDDAPDAPPDPHGGLQRGARWPEAAFTSPDYYDLIADSERLLYAGRDEEAAARVDRDWKALGQSALLRLRFVGIDARYLRARCNLRVAARAGLAARERGRLLAVVADDMRRVARSGEALAEAYAQAIAAGLAHASGDRTGTVAAHERAAAAFTARGMQAHAAAASRGAAVVRGDAAAAARAEERLAGLGVVRPARLAGVLVPSPG